MKKTRINMLLHEYEIFKMKDEKIEAMFERLPIIVNDVHNLERIITNAKLFIEVLRTLPKSW